MREEVAVRDAEAEGVRRAVGEAAHRDVAEVDRPGVEHLQQVRVDALYVGAEGVEDLLALGLGAFALMAAYVAGCDRV